MAIPAELTKLLADFLVAVLRERNAEEPLGQEVHSAAIYETKLQDAALVTPLVVVQHRADLQQSPSPLFTRTEQACLIRAAYLLTGLVPCLRCFSLVLA